MSDSEQEMQLGEESPSTQTQHRNGNGSGNGAKKERAVPRRSAASAASKRIADDEDDDENENGSEDDDYEEQEEDEKPKKKAAAPVKRAASAPKRKQPKKRARDEDDDDEEEDADEDDNEEDEDEDADEDENDEDEDEGEDEDEDEDEDEEEEEEEDDEAPKRKRATKAKPKKKAKAAKKTKRTTENGEKTLRSKANREQRVQLKLKTMNKLARIDEARRAFKWWEAEDLPAGIQWRYLEHRGVNFAPEYQPHGVKMLYDGEEVELTPEEERLATFYALVPEDGPQLGNKETRATFQKNFFEDFKAVLRPGHKIKKFEKCDFTPIRQYVDQQRLIKKAASAEEKAKTKAEKERLQGLFGLALIDGRIEKLGNFNIEPPGLFRGRGKHPLTGKLKEKVIPEQVTLNLSDIAPVPPCTVPGHAWEGIRHDPTVTWMATWKENVLNNNKYVQLAASSSFKGKSDRDKYQKAIRLKGCIDRIRADYKRKLSAKNIDDRQLGTAMWVIDVLALRVGGEKGEDEADTVGCCTLRLEHVRFTPGDEVYEIELEFLGKDSMLYKQLIDFSKYGEIGVKVYENIKAFCRGKRPTDDVFDRLTPPILNAHLSSLMKGLSAKVFRTYNASETLQKELPSAESLEGLSIQDKVLAYNAANREVAILCNHQRSVSKAMQATFENLNEKLEVFKSQRRELQKFLKLVKSRDTDGIRLKQDDEEKTELVRIAKERAEQMKSEAKTDEEKLAATAAAEEARLLKQRVAKEKLLEAHLFKSIPTADQLEKRIEQWSEKIRKLEIDIRNRDENKEVALGTSKINYMDPRISVAWCKRCEVPIERIFAKTLREKFNWAMAVPPDWRFE